MTQRRNVSSESTFEAEVGYSRGVRVGPYVAVSGTTAPGDTVADQAREALRRIETALIDTGASLSDVVRTRMFVTDIATAAEVTAVHGAMFGDIRPAATLVQVSALIDPSLLVEIEAEARRS